MLKISNIKALLISMIFTGFLTMDHENHHHHDNSMMNPSVLIKHNPLKLLNTQVQTFQGLPNINDYPIIMDIKNILSIINIIPQLLSIPFVINNFNNNYEPLEPSKNLMAPIAMVKMINFLNTITQGSYATYDIINDLLMDPVVPINSIIGVPLFLCVGNDNGCMNMEPRLEIQRIYGGQFITKCK